MTTSRTPSTASAQFETGEAFGVGIDPTAESAARYTGDPEGLPHALDMDALISLAYQTATFSSYAAIRYRAIGGGIIQPDVAMMSQRLRFLLERLDLDRAYVGRCFTYDRSIPQGLERGAVAWAWRLLHATYSDLEEQLVDACLWRQSVGQNPRVRELIGDRARVALAVFEALDEMGGSAAVESIALALPSDMSIDLDAVTHALADAERFQAVAMDGDIYITTPKTLGYVAYMESRLQAVDASVDAPSVVDSHESGFICY